MKDCRCFTRWCRLTVNGVPRGDETDESLVGKGCQEFQRDEGPVTEGNELAYWQDVAFLGQKT